MHLNDHIKHKKNIGKACIYVFENVQYMENMEASAGTENIVL